MSSRIRPAGFTLVEMLVVIAIIGVLMGLLLPAVQSAREAGRRVTCVNNQYQLARAVMRADDQNGFLPGWRNRVNSGTFSWTVPILPFMERNDIFKNVTTTAPTVYVSFFVCPSSPPAAMSAPTLAYAGNCGSASNLGPIPVTSTTNARRCDGVMVDTTATGAMAFRLSLDTVSENDGSATTLLLSEKCNSGTAGLIQGSWNASMVASNIANGSFTFTNTSTGVPGFGITNTATWPKVVNSSVLGNSGSITGQINMPSSNHPGGAVAAFADGHTVFLKDSLAGQVYAQLLSWNHAGASNISRGTGGWRANEKAVLSEGDYQ